MDDRMPLESVIGIIRDVQSLEELGPSLEELMQRRAEEALPEPPRTGKEEERLGEETRRKIYSVLSI